jgi:hypothetical protein
MYKKTIFSVLIFATSFAIGWQVLSWTGPTGTAPSGNAPAPINVSSTAQTKEGNLSVAMFYDTNDPSYYINPSGATSAVLAGNVGIGTTNPTAKLQVEGSLEITGTSSYLKFPMLTTAQRDALTPETGMTIFNSTTGQLEVYVPSEWKKVASGAPVGGNCTNPGDCDSGFCVDNWCCDTACDGFCEACSGAKKGYGSDGYCGYIGAGLDPDNECTASGCTSDGTCNGSGACSGNVAAGTDPNNYCTASYTGCNGAYKVGPDGNCDGSGACNTGGLSSFCPTSTPPCSTGGGCSGGNCVSVSNQPIDSQPSGCTGCNYCNGSGSCVACGWTDELWSCSGLSGETTVTVCKPSSGWPTTLVNTTTASGCGSVTGYEWYSCGSGTGHHLHRCQCQ